jgi:hypothetical protein
MRTGWEHDTPDDDTVMRQWVLTNLTRYRVLTERVGGRIDVWDAAALFDTASSVVFDNAAVLRRPMAPEELSELIDTAHVFFSHERPWLLFSAWPLPDLTDAELSLMGHPPFMLRPAGEPPLGARRVVEGLEIVRVSPQQAPLFATTLHAGFELAPGPDSPWADPRVLDADDVVAFIGYVDGEPVATAAAFLAHGVVDVEMVSCLRSHRGRGIGEALTWAATLADPSAPAMLMASDDGQPIYRRMGYLPIDRMTLWFAPAADAEA